MTVCILFFSVWHTAQAQNKPSPVAVATVIEKTLSEGHRFVGTVMPVRKSIVGSAVDGRVLEFHVDRGDAVQKGQPLAQLRTQTLEIALAAAEAELKLRQEELAELENGTRPEEIRQAEAQLMSAKALMEYKKAKHARIRSLFEQGRTVTEDELQENLADAVQAEQAYFGAVAQHELLVQGPRQERIAQARARVLVQTEKVRQIEDQLEKHTIVSPFDGYVTTKHTEVGEWVEKAQPVAEIVELDHVDIQIHVLSAHAGHLRHRTSARVELPGLPHELFTGTLVGIIPQAETRTRTFPIEIRVTNRIDESGPFLKSGMMAHVELPVGKEEPMTLIPKDALVLGGAQPVIFVVDSKSGAKKTGIVRQETVELGIAVGPLIQVRGNVKAGDSVVVQGNERLQAGQDVAIMRVILGDDPA